MKAPSSLQAQLANQILAYIQANQLQPETHLPEPVLCEHFKVSRTPVRAALSLLKRRGYLRHVPNQGYFTAKPPSAVRARAVPPSDEERLYLTIAEDRIGQRLPEHVSEADLLRRYNVAKALLGRVLQRLLREGLVERRPGRGWMFAPVLDSQLAHDESYRFRMAIEPMALLEPGFHLDEEAAARSAAKHQRILNGDVSEITPIELFEMNAEFHELLAASARNRFFLQAVQQQNRLRRFVNYHWVYGPDRAVQVCREHMSVLQAVQMGDMSWASTLLRRHLESSSTVSPYAEQPAGTMPERVIRLNRRTG